MSVQPVLEVHFPAGRTLTWEDLQSIPDDQHHHYELVDGSLLTSPSPDLRHQNCVLEFAARLRLEVPRHLIVVVAPFDFVPRAGFSLQPDVMVLERDRVEVNRTVVAPLLAVEVMSPCSRSTDPGLKRLVYEEHGVQHYWIVDPQGPSVRAMHLVDARYVDHAVVRDGERFGAREPIVVEFSPHELLND